MVRDTESLIPVKVKANNNATVSLNNLINNDKYKNINYAIKILDLMKAFILFHIF